MRENAADIVIIGGSTGGCAAALAACRNGKTVVMSEETQWIGGQLTSQTVPPDEHRFIEWFGSSESYRELRRRIRAYYLDNFPVSTKARAARWFNPGNHECSTLACEPRAALAALTEMLAPYVHGGRLVVHQGYRPVSAETDGDTVRSVHVQNQLTGDSIALTAHYFLDATELGDLLPLAGIEHVVGAEPQEETAEPHAYPGGNERCQMAITWCFAMDYLEGEDHTIDRPEKYEFFRDSVPPHWPNPQLSFVALDYDTMGPWQHTFLPVVHGGPLWESLWLHRRMIDKDNFVANTYASDVVHVNWTQNDYFWGPILVSRTRSAPATSTAHASSASRSSTGCRPKHHVSTADTASRASVSDRTWSAPQTGSQCIPTSARRGGFAPSAPCSNNTSAPRRERTGPSATTTRSQSATTSSTCISGPRRRRRSSRRCGPTRSRSAR